MPSRPSNGQDGGMDELTRLAVAAQNGDRTSLERFVRTAQGDVWRLCRYLSDEHAADDLAQEAQH